jgi:hypothetical protein
LPARSFIEPFGFMMSTAASLWRLADLEVVLVVRGRHLEHARAELEIHVFIADDRDELFLRGNSQGRGRWRACR